MLIVIEGADGAGTTSVSQKLANDFGGIYTREPSDGCVGQTIRKILHGSEPFVNWREMSYLFHADRIRHVAEMKARPNVFWFCDRYYISTLVYQSVSDNWDEAVARMGFLYNEVRGTYDVHAKTPEEYEFVQPDLLIFLDADPQTLVDRRKFRGLPEELYENEETQKKVVDLYRYWWQNLKPKNSHRVDANLPFGDVYATCAKLVKGAL